MMAGQNISEGWKTLRNHVKLVWLVYSIQLLLALTIGLQVYHVIESSMGHSVTGEEIVSGFNYAIIKDLLNVHGASLSPLIGQVRWYVLLYLLFSVFINGGILYTIRIRGNDWLDFWKGGATYFRKFLVISGFYLILALIWTLVLWIPALAQLFGAIEHLNRETLVYYGVLALFIIWITGLTFLFAVSFFSKLAGLDMDRGKWSSIKTGWTFTFTHISHILLFFGFYGLLTILAYLANFWLELTVGITSEFLILAFMLVQQLIVIGKIGLRLALYGTLNAFALDKGL